MKHFLLLIFCISSTYAFAQNDSINISEINSVWKNKADHFPLKKGFYKTYDEFLTNSPSEQRDFTLIEKTKSQERKEKGICAVNFNIQDGEDKVGKIWGFCDGNAVYIKASPLESKYWKVAYIGPYSYFVHIYQVRTLASAISGAAMGTREFSVINSKGKMVYATENYMKKLLEKCPGLVEEYKTEAEPKNEEVKKKYLQRLNEYLATQ